MDTIADRIAKFCEDTDVTAIDIVKGKCARKSVGVCALHTGKVLSEDRDATRRLRSAWVRYSDGSRLHYVRGEKPGERYARAYVRKPMYSHPRDLVLPAKFLGLKDQDKRIVLMDSKSEWIRDLRRTGNRYATVARLVAYWLHDNYGPIAEPQKIRTLEEVYTAAKKLGIKLLNVEYRRKLVGFEYDAPRRPSGKVKDKAFEALWREFKASKFTKYAEFIAHKRAPTDIDPAS